MTRLAGTVGGTAAFAWPAQVAGVSAASPSAALMPRLGFELVDPPGVGSAIEVNTATTRRFLPQADAVIFVTGFDSSLTETEVRFLARAPAAGDGPAPTR